jgi:branched-chain amino acid transport system ATP-binding protein
METAMNTIHMHSWDRNVVLSVEHLTMRFGGLVAVNDLSFNVGRGDITALIGPNGAGKTTVFNCVTGFYKPTEGRIVMRHGDGLQAQKIEALTRSGKQFDAEGDNRVFLLERMPDFEISKRAKVARTFQNIRLFGGMTALENLLVAQHNPLMIASSMTIGGILNLPGFRKARGEAIDFAAYWLEKTGLIDRADDPAADLPYGDQRRLEIARAMCTRPQLLCLDEPAAGLNPRESTELNELLQNIRKDHGTSILLIEHDMGVVMQISDHVVVLDYGEKISDGSAEMVKNDPKVISAYLGVDEDEVAAIEEIAEDLPELVAKAKKAGDPGKAAKVAKTVKPAKADKPAGAEPAVSEIVVENAGSHPGAQPAGIKAARGGTPDKLTRVKGIGPVNETKLNALGIWHFDQIAAWKKKEVEWVGSYLAFPGRIEREDWVKQAKALARDAAGKPAKPAKGGKA